MPMLLFDVLLFALGFGAVIKGAGWLVDGAAHMARALRVPQRVIGLTVVAFGTSMPELVVNVTSSFRGSGGIVLGNIVGSNIMNIGLVLGLSGLVAPLAVRRDFLRREMPLALAGSALMLVLPKGEGASLVLGRVSGLVLLLGFILFVETIRRFPHGEELLEDIEQIVTHSTRRAVLMVLLGLAGLVLGGHYAVEGAAGMARRLGVSEELIGLTLVAIGTSLPELVTCVTAAVRGRMDLVIGNVIGSNIFNIFLVLGVSVAVRPVVFEAALRLDLSLLTAFSLALLLLSRSGRLTRGRCLLLLLGYGSYLAYAIHRG